MPLRSSFRRAILIGAPLMTAIWELLHPKAELATMFTDAPLLATWIAVHVGQLFLFSIVAVALTFLVGERSGPLASLSRWAAAAFAVIYGAYDALAGIATGVFVASSQAVPEAASSGLVDAVRAYFASVESGPYAWIGVTGAFCWVVACLAAAAAMAPTERPVLASCLLLVAAAMETFGNDLLWHPFRFIGLAVLLAALFVISNGGRSRPVLVGLLGIAGLVLTAGHPAPFGTVAFGSLALAAAWNEAREGFAGSADRTVARLIRSVVPARLGS